MERVARTADALNEIAGKPRAIGLHGGEIGKVRQDPVELGLTKPEARSAESAEIVNPAVVHGERGSQTGGN